MDDSSLLAIACHEAGHAIAAIIFGASLSSIAVDPNPAVGAAKGTTSIEELRAHLWRRKALIALAGPAAQQHHYPNSAEEHDAALDHYRFQTELLGQARRRLTDIEDDDASDHHHERYEQGWKDRAQRLVRTKRFERATLALASALQNNAWTLQGEAATTIILASLKVAKGRCANGAQNS